MFMVNFLLICNYFFIRKLRDTVDRYVKENDKMYLQQLQEFKEQLVLQLGLNQTHETKTALDADRIDRSSSICLNIICACVFGRTTKTCSVAARFPKWQPIPFKLGIFSTWCVLITAIFLLSDDLLNDRVSVDVSRESSSGFCVTGGDKANITAFEDYIQKNVTNFHVASKQRNQTLLVRDALVNGTKLYGTGGRKCMGETQETYKKRGKDIKYGEFFPGYCEEYLYTQVEQALKRKCPTTEYCMKDLCDGWQCTVATAAYNKCIDIPTICDDREQALEKAMDRMRRSHDKKTQRMDKGGINIQSPEVPNDDDLKRSAETIDSVLKQIDIAGTMYCFFILLALFFPSPLQLFRLPLLIRVKQFIFGINKMTFIAIVLIIWWAFQFLTILSHSPEFKNYLKNIITDPCLIDSDFISARIDIVQNICTDLLQKEHEWGLAMAEINQIKPAIDSWYSDCDCEFNDIHFLPLSMSIHDAEEIHFDNHWNHLIPKINSTFLGNGTICINTKYARDEILVADESSLSFWELWIMSGLLASFFVKIAISNFGIALLKLADPFCICEGTYESPPSLNKNIDQEHVNTFIVDERVKQDKAAELRAIAIRDCIAWGAIANTCLLTLFVTAWSNLGEYKTTDCVLFAIVMLLCASLPIGCFSVTRYTNNLVSKKLDKEDIIMGDIVADKLEKEDIIMKDIIKVEHKV